MSAVLGSKAGGHRKGKKGDLDLSDALPDPSLPAPIRISSPIVFLRHPGEGQSSEVLDRVTGGRQAHLSILALLQGRCHPGSRHAADIYSP